MRTNYKKRLRILMSNKVRLVVRKSLKNLQVSLIDYSAKGDKILFTINSTALGKLGWKFDCGNIPSAYLTGMLAGKKAIEKGVKEAVLDLGFNTPSKGSRLYAALAGAIDAGLKIPFSCVQARVPRTLSLKMPREKEPPSLLLLPLQNARE